MRFAVWRHLAPLGLAATIAALAACPVSAGDPPEPEVVLRAIPSDTRQLLTGGPVAPLHSSFAVRSPIARLFFGFDSDKLDQSSLTKLRSIAADLSEIDIIGKVELQFFGHTDSVGSSEYNRGLAGRRIRGVMGEMSRTLGRLPPAELYAVGDQDLAGDPRGPFNRRVDVMLKCSGGVPETCQCRRRESARKRSEPTLNQNPLKDTLSLSLVIERPAGVTDCRKLLHTEVRAFRSATGIQTTSYQTVGGRVVEKVNVWDGAVETDDEVLVSILPSESICPIGFIGDEYATMQLGVFDVSGKLVTRVTSGANFREVVGTPRDRYVFESDVGSCRMKIEAIVDRRSRLPRTF